MVLVEKICQLSFENDAQTTTTPMSGVESAAQRPLASADANCQASAVVSDEGCDETDGTVTPSDVVAARPLDNSEVNLSVTSVVASHALAPPLPPPVAHLLPPLPPALIPSQNPLPGSHGDDDSVRAPNEASAETDAENTWTSAADGSGATTVPTSAALEPSVSCNSATSSLNRKRSSRRSHAKPARAGGCRGRGAGKTEDADVIERTEDKMRGVKMRPLRQRNCDRTTQPWVACNKSLVYRMIDSALGATETAAPTVTRQLVVTPPVALETEIRSGEKRSAVVGTIEVDAGRSVAIKPKDHAEEPRRPTRSPDASCEAPLLGALLSHDDVGVTNNARDIPILPIHPPSLFRHLPRGSSPLKTIRRFGSNCHRTFSEELGVPLPPLGRNLRFGCSDRMFDHPFAASPMLPLRNAEDLAPRRSANRDILRSNMGFSAKSSRFAQQTGSRSNSLRNSDRLSSDLDPLPTQSRRMEASAKTTVGPTSERPRWIALDKDEVRSLVDSLVSTMMTSDNDVTRVSAAIGRKIASPSNAVCNKDDHRSLSYKDVGNRDNDETGFQRLTVTVNDSGRHDNGEESRRLVTTDSGRYDDDEATIEYDRFMGVDLDRYDNGKRVVCRRSRAMQCLATDGSGDYPADPGSGGRDNGGECSGVRGVPEGLARNMKWKSSMLLRLHSQSQDD